MWSELKKLQDIYLNNLKDSTILLPRIIHIETRSKCNGICNFCPASSVVDNRKDIHMSTELIEKIINELGGLDYLNRISFYNNNEPFLDERIFQIIKLARDKIICNESTGTWWIDLAIQKKGCAPACVVDVAIKKAEINWRCSGLIIN